MNLEGDLPKQTKSFNPPKALIIVVAVLITAIIAGTGGYLLGRTHTLMASSGLRPSTSTSTIMSPTPTASQTSLATTTVATVTIQDDYFFTLQVPSGYQLTSGRGDYIKYLSDDRDNILIGFSIGRLSGERGPNLGVVRIDDVQFDVEAYTTTYKPGSFDCPMILSPSDLEDPSGRWQPGSLYLGIVTWCGTGEETSNRVFDDVIRSIRFSQNLRGILTGTSQVLPLKFPIDYGGGVGQGQGSIHE